MQRQIEQREIELKDTADIRRKMLEVWRLVNDKKISTSEARLHIGLARVILETLKVEIAAAHLSRSDIPSVSIKSIDVARRQ
jgi:hypothetical protein